MKSTKKRNKETADFADFRGLKKTSDQNISLLSQAGMSENVTVFLPSARGGFRYAQHGKREYREHRGCLIGR